MLKVAKLGIGLAAVLAWIAPAAYAGVPDVNLSFYVPQSGSTVAAPTEGTAAARFFRMCPNNDGNTSTSSLPFNARLKVIIRDAANNPIAGVAAADIYILLNGGLTTQNFNGNGADSITANGTWDVATANCPNLNFITADAPSDAAGVAFITLGGADATAPGVFVRNGARKWGRADTSVPVFVLGFPIGGKLTSAGTGTYVCQLRGIDMAGGYNTGTPPGSAPWGTINVNDFNTINARNGGAVRHATEHWADLDFTSLSSPAAANWVNVTDYNILNAHNGHECDSPNP